jgi:hypothetical protein
MHSFVDRSIQGDHFSEKLGNVRDFDYCQGNVREFSQGSVREFHNVWKVGTLSIKSASAGAACICQQMLNSVKLISGHSYIDNK